MTLSEMAKGHRDLCGLRCAVLGAGGFFGTNLSIGLARHGASVTAVGRSIPTEDLSEAITWEKAELGDRVSLRHAVEGADIVFYLLAASVPGTPTRDPLLDLSEDCGPALNLLQVCREVSVGRIIFASSGGAVYGVPTTIPISEAHSTNPISPYGISKLLIEKYLHLYNHAHGIRSQILRVANPYGPYQRSNKRQGLIAEIVHKLLNKQAIEVWGDGSVVRDYIYIDDVVTAFIDAACYEGEHRVMNVGSGVGRSITDVIGDVGRIMQISEPEMIFKFARNADVPVNILDSSRLSEGTGWQPRVAWEDGLRGTVQWAAGDLPRPGVSFK